MQTTNHILRTFKDPDSALLSWAMDYQLKVKAVQKEEGLTIKHPGFYKNAGLLFFNYSYLKPVAAQH